MYLTYDEYISMGGTAEKPGFQMLEFRARKHLDCLTDCRIQRMKEIPEAVKLCMTSMINVEAKAGLEAQLEAPQITSFSTDGYTESYANAMSVSQARKEQDDLVRSMLYGELDDDGTPLLFRGLF